MTDGEEVPGEISVRVLREGFRNLHTFLALYESEGIDTLQAEDGTILCLWDLLWLLDQVHSLAPQQRRAIELFLVEDLPEARVAVIMGTPSSNPIGTYATDGIKRLLVRHRKRAKA